MKDSGRAISVYRSSVHPLPGRRAVVVFAPLRAVPLPGSRHTRASRPETWRQFGAVALFARGPLRTCHRPGGPRPPACEACRTALATLRASLNGTALALRLCTKCAGDEPPPGWSWNVRAVE